MGLIINQGRQDTSKMFEVHEAKAVNVVINKIEMHPTLPLTLRIKMTVIAGPLQGKVVGDDVSYDPNSNFAWKYLTLRSAVGRPYDVNESPTIDIEAILMNKVLQVDLYKRMDKDGVNAYQGVKFLPNKQAAVATPGVQTVTVAGDDWNTTADIADAIGVDWAGDTPNEDTPEITIELSDADLPFM